MQQSVFTIAGRSQKYLKLAFSLARSFVLTNDPLSIAFYILSDLQFDMPADLSFVQTLELPKELADKGIGVKLHLDELSPTQRAIFLDADCLVFQNLQSVFDRFRGRPVSVVGVTVSDGDWCGPRAETLCLQLGISGMPRFNGGLYYLEKGDKARRVYQTARELEPEYDRLGFLRHREWINDEPLVSLAMALHAQSPIGDDGSILSDLGAGLQRTFIDVVGGKSILYNPLPPSSHHKWWQNTRGQYSPAIIHFSDDFPYNRECYKLRLNSFSCSSKLFTRTSAFFLYTAPYWTSHAIKWLGRPIYRRLFGIRPIRPSDRTRADDGQQLDAPRG